jgi:hypothetical protein
MNIKTKRQSSTIFFSSSFFQVTVELRLVFLKIGEIDTLKEQFQAEAFIQARWSEPTLKGTVSEM